MKIKTILAPVDFSGRSEAEVENAVNIALHFGARIVVLRVVPDCGHLHAIHPRAVEAYEREFSAEIRQGAAEALDEVARRLGAGSDIETAVAHGDPAAEIEQAVLHRGIDLVVMPTAGGGHFRRLLLGSVATKVLHDLECPVMTGVHMPEVQPRAAHPYQRIACLVDLDGDSERVLAWARDFAGAYDAQFHLLHAPPFLQTLGAGPYMPANLMPAYLEHAREKAEQLLERVGLDAPILIQPGEVEDALPKAILESGANVVVTGRRRPDGRLGLAGLRVDLAAAIRHSPCPVISL